MLASEIYEQRISNSRENLYSSLYLWYQLVKSSEYENLSPWSSLMPFNWYQTKHGTFNSRDSNWSKSNKLIHTENRREGEKSQIIPVIYFCSLLRVIIVCSSLISPNCYHSTIYSWFWAIMRLVWYQFHKSLITTVRNNTCCTFLRGHFSERLSDFVLPRIMSPISSSHPRYPFLTTMSKMWILSSAMASSSELAQRRQRH